MIGNISENSLLLKYISACSSFKYLVHKVGGEFCNQ